MAFSDPTKRQRPAPLGFSVGHPLVTAGTIGARVKDQSGNVYVLSNNHVLANSNGSTIGDPIYQPGVYDGGTAADQIGTLSVFRPIAFGGDVGNTIDAAIARSSVDNLDNATPADDGYGLPSGKIYGDADNDGFFDDRDGLLGLHVQKYGRTTKLTHGQITGVNASVNVCYEVSGFDCTKSALFVDQLVIEPGGFSGGGDSGSLIVTDDGDRSPVGLLFAGSSSYTVANRIDLVLAQFGVSIDAPPPGPRTDVAISALTVAPSVARDPSVDVTVTVRNVGNQPVPANFDVTLRDSTANVTIGTQQAGNLDPGATVTLTYHWNTSSSAFGTHVLTASLSLADDNAANNQKSASTSVDPPLTDVAVTAVTGPVDLTIGGTATISVTVANIGNQKLTAPFNVKLWDQTSGDTIGVQTISTLLPGTNTTLTFNWNTTGAPLGRNLLVAAHTLTDDVAGNNIKSVAVTVNPPRLDVAMTDFSGPGTAIQGDTVTFSATVQNQGQRDATTPFNIVLTDLTTGSAIDSQPVNGLVVGASSTVTLKWKTAGATIGGHTLAARQMLPDDSTGDDSRAIGIQVNPPPIPPTDVAVTAVNAPASVTQGTTASVVVTVQNVGQQPTTSSFTVVLNDQTAGTTIGTQTVSGLAVGASTSLTFSWNTTGTPLGNHTLTANHNLADNNPANNQRSATVAVNAKITDIALTAFTVPNPITQGTTVNIGVTVNNDGQQDVTSGFSVVVTDATAGVTIGTQTVPSLAIGASSTLTFPWNTTGVATGGHTLIAKQMLSDFDGTNNSRAAGISVNAPVTQTTDVAITGISAPASLRVGQSATVSVTLGNIGTQAVGSSFTVMLQDATDNVTLGTQTVLSLPVNASTSVSFNWSAANASIGNHTLVATHNLNDANAANNQRSITVPVTAQITDIAVSSMSTPGSVTQGATANINVLIQNLGDKDVTTSFDVVLTDVTGGVIIGTQTIPSLVRAANTVLTFPWNTGSASVATHTLTASITLTDDNAANNQRSATLTVNRKTIDISLASFTPPASIPQGNTVNIPVVVQNVGQLDVTANFNVTVTDGTTGVTIGTQTVSGLVVGASSTLTFPWNTTGLATGGHTLFAKQLFSDDNPGNNSRAAGISITPPSVHVGNLNGSSTNNGDGTWTASVEVTVHDMNHNLVDGAVVQGSWGSTTGSCTTGSGTGTCIVTLASLPNTTNLVSFAVSSVTATGYVYQPSANHDPDGSSNGTTVFMSRPQ
jgi:hypothetical protein